MTDTIASFWETARCCVRDGRASDVPRLTGLYNSCSALENVDPTFGIVAEAEIGDLVARSTTGSSGFRLQVIGLGGSDELIGYFHLTHGLPRPDTTWVSIFVVGNEYQRAGYGGEVSARLLCELGALAWCHAVWLKVYLGNEMALRHWVSAGFRRIVEVRVATGATIADKPSVVLACDLR